MSIQNNEERQVVLGNTSDEDAASQMRRERGATTAGEVGSAVPNFTKVSDFTTFVAEYTFKGGDDLVVHFFLAPEITKGPPDAVQLYWVEKFPQSLDRVAREYFNANAPRLLAKYTPELRSWWFQARGYGDRIDPDAFVLRFLERLDSDLDSR